MAKKEIENGYQNWSQKKEKNYLILCNFEVKNYIIYISQSGILVKALNFQITIYNCRKILFPSHKVYLT